MIVVFEQDTTVRNGRRFVWKPFVFRGHWDGRKTWRFGWGLWSVSFYPSSGLRSFFDHVQDGNTMWFGDE